MTLGDGVNVTEDTKTKAKRNSGRSCYDIGWEYHETIKDYSKAMAWYQIAVSKNYSLVHNNIGLLYDGGLGVPQNYDIAMEFYLKAAVTNNAVALANIGECFLKGQGVPIDEYKALEWFLKSGTGAREVNKLNREEIHLKRGDKSKLYYQVIIIIYYQLIILK
jgi:TPR repeat protein